MALLTTNYIGKINFKLYLISFLFFTNSYSQKKDSIEKYNLKFQMTSIYQWHPAFQALYSGTNSMQTQEQRASSLTSTLYLDVPLWKGGLFTLNPEMSGGEGLSSTRGLGGFPNGETFRIGESKPMVYLARIILQQKFQLTKKKSIQIVTGKFGLSDYFDTNSYSHDPRTQFINWSLMTNGAWDYAANTRGYTDGIYANYQFYTWQIRGSFSALPTTANGPDLEFSFNKLNAINIELEKKITFYNNDTSIIKVLLYRNLAPMGNYNQAIEYYIATPDIISTRLQGRTKYGLGINAEYSHSDTWGLFGRLSYNDGKNETWAFTEIDQSASLGITLKGKMWNRKDDFLGIAFVANGLSPSHIKYQQLGGNGFMIGDGNLNYGLEKIVEVFYSYSIPHTSFTLSPDYQFALNPGYNRDRGPIQFLAMRFHAQI